LVPAAYDARVPEDPTRAQDEAAILDAFLARCEQDGIELYPAQEAAILEFYAGNHVILNTPTGSGKTLVAEAVIHRALALGRRVFYTSPVKALANEKFFALGGRFGAERVGMMTGDAQVNPRAPVICCTAEILARIALRGFEQAPVDDVVIDEFHYFGDPDRGMAWQIPLVAMPHVAFLLMSATLGDVRDIEQKLEARTGRPVTVVRSDDRPVPLSFDYVTTPLTETVETLVAEGKAPIYLVSFTHRECFEWAQSLSSVSLIGRDERKALAQAVRATRFDTPAGRAIKRALLHGIGIHNAGMLPKYRRLVERLAQAGLLKVVCGTDTLGVGVNIPIRTVLFNKLCKFDGTRTRIVSVRDFHQIAGRAGRKGFDEAGFVVVQAPEHVIENLRRERKAGGDPKKRRKIVWKKPPARGYAHWDEKTFRRLVEGTPEPLASNFRLSHGILVDCLDRFVAHGRRDGGYRRVLALIEHSYERPALHSRHRRYAARLFRSLVGAGVVELVRVPWSKGPAVRVDPAMRRELSLFHTLSLYLLEVLQVIDPGADDQPTTVLSLAEAIAETPEVVLRAQVSHLKDARMAELRADGADYDTRMAELEKIEAPAPCADLVEATYDTFRAAHPWLETVEVRPKSIARWIYERQQTFPEFIHELGLSRAEGVVYRYLGQVYRILARIVPPVHDTEGVVEIRAYLRTLLARVDDSLLREWEALAAGEDAGVTSAPEDEARVRARSARERRALLRATAREVARALAAEDFEDACRGLVRDDDGEPVDPHDLARALDGFVAEHGRVLFDPPARAAHLTHVSEQPDGWTRVVQTLCGEDGPTTYGVFLRVPPDWAPGDPIRFSGVEG